MGISKKNRLSVLFVCILLTASFFSFTPAFCADWSHWRGPDYNGISKEADFDPAKLKDGVEPLWEADIGIGFATMSISSGKVYAMGNINKNTDVISCFDAVSGKQIWKFEYPEPLSSQNYEGGCSATPTVADGKVYTISKTGKIFCFKADTGEVIWQRQVSAKLPQWGFAGSAFITGDKVIFNIGTFGAAFNKDSGEPVWNTGDEPSGYATAVPFKDDSILVFGGKALAAVSITDGKILWQSPWETKYGVNASDPIVSENKIFITSGYNQGCSLLQVTDNEPTEVYTNKNMRSQLSGPVLIDGYLYGIDDNQLVCLEMKTGDVKWTTPEIGKGSLVAADKKLIVLSEKGKLYIANASAESFDVISSAQIFSGKCWTMPVLANGLVYARNAAGSLVCLDLRKPASAAPSTGNSSASSDWPNYRGPNHDNISTETGMDFSKVKEGIQPLWKANINTGFSAVSISGGRVYSVGNANDTDIVCCLDALTGKQVWKHEYPEPLNPQMYEGGCNSTPTVASGKVYTLSKTGKIFCLDAAADSVIWKKEISFAQPKWGFSGSALVIGDLVVFNLGTTGTAFNKDTGEIVWQSGSEAAGYATPVPYKEGSVLIFAARGVAAVNLSDGKILFESPWPTRNGVNAADPVYADDKIFITSGYNQGCALLQAAGTEVKEVYANKNMRSHLSGPVLIDGYLYGMDDKQLACLEMATGDLKWTAPEIGKGTIMAVGKKLVVLSETGKLCIANAVPGSFDVITSAQILTGKCWTMPSIANGLLYARNATGDLVCFDLRAEAPADSAAKTLN